MGWRVIPTHPVTPDDPGDTDVPAEAQTFTLTNSGNPDKEGHTPRGFQGQGGGLFTGDNINGGFPEFEGTQIFLSINLKQAPEGDLTDGDWAVQSAVLSSDNVEFNGTPFADLGVLEVEEVVFDDFSSVLWDLEPVTGGAACTLADSMAGPFACDLAPAVQAALDDGRKFAQFRIRMTELGDGDGQPDMVLFSLGNTNTTEAGIFDLVVEATPL